MTRANHISKDHFKMKLKRVGYLLFLLPAVLPACAYLLWHYRPSVMGSVSADVFAWLPLLMLYGLIPVLDGIIGKETLNPLESDVKTLSEEYFYQGLLAICIPLALASLTLGLWLFSSWNELSLVGKLGLILSFGTVHAGLMINTGHELIHKRSKSQQRAGGILLSMVCYPSFKIEHVRGHHVNVATRLDNSTARRGESLYAFLWRALLTTVRTAWSLEAQLLRKRHQPVISWHNELIRWYMLVLAMAAVAFVLFGLSGLVFFAVQSVVAVGLLETVNYLEHYGLSRKQLANGRYERTTHHHSWNSSYLLSNLMSFQLQRHSDHHANPQRHYQVLRHFDDSPQLPAGYATMVMLAMIPPLWMRVMNPRIDGYYKEENVPG